MSPILKTAALALTLLALPATAHAADEPPHTVVAEDSAIQVRDYAAMILAEVEVSGDMGDAGNAGFRPLAGYIFGGNQARAGGSDEIAMTAPVIQTQSENIAMTTPVTQSMAGNGSWRVAFVMPPEWTMETLPVPEDPNVTLTERPARRMAAIRFSGGPNDARFADKTAELRAWLSAQGYEVIGEPVYARYDPPWIPTFFRRNEVMLEVAR
ncbi:SOUL family heme-binding protein [Maricaulis sp.]|uniref:SOUL family heme-binding protein n=1 Tax=Maricaulis sp. TaxID=1486257 RepID=UPI003A8E457E